MPVAAKGLENLKKRKPFQKGHPGMGGHPRTADLVEAMRQTYLGPGSLANRKRLLRVMERKCPQIIAHYLSGKPTDQVILDANITAHSEQAELAKSIARELAAARIENHSSSQG